MRKLGSRSAAIAIGMLVFASSTMLLQPAHAQYGGGGYGGGYDQRRQSDGEGYDRRRGSREDIEPRGGREDRSRDRRDSGAQAGGSFVQSCREIEQEGAYLSASCRMRGGGYNRSRIDTRSCRSIGNSNGRLTCE